MTPGDAEGVPPAYSVRQSERAEVERDDIFFQLTRVVGPAYAGKWLAGFGQAVNKMTAFPGPLSHAVDEEASDVFGREVRRMLYRGPDGRSKTAYRIYFTLLPPGEGESDTTILVLRILHGARPFVNSSDEGEEDA